MSSPQTPRLFAWRSGLWGPKTHWLSSPDVAAIESVARKHLPLSANDNISATFFAGGAFNRLFAITVSNSGSTLGTPQYIFRATAPVEPFFKTAGEVATLSYLREYTSIPVPRIIAHSSTSDNEVGLEWILMEKLPGVALADVWSAIDLETKEKVTRSVVGYVRQLRDLRGRFTGLGNLYFREDIDPAVRVLCTDDEKYVLGPLVTPYMFSGGRKLRVPRDLGPYTNDAEYIAALAASQLEEMKLLQSPDAGLHSDFDAGLAEDAADIIGLLDKLQPILSVIFPSQPRNFGLHHHDLALRNILVDPATYQITGIVDWESVGTRPHWEDTYPQFLIGPLAGITQEIEPLAPKDKDPCAVEQWENSEEMKLRLVFDRELGEARHDDDGMDELRWEFRRHLDIVGVKRGLARRWLDKLESDCANILSE